ncbi:MAG: transposase [Nitrosospira sp.]|nr:transposase [Nitrosospira sp.]
MDKPSPNIFQLFKMFPDAESARRYLEGRLWPTGAKCATCKTGDRITSRKDGYYRCNACKLDFTVRTGTIFERSHVPLHKWIYAMYLLVTTRKGISSLQLSKQIDITQKSAWSVLQRLREACGNDLIIPKAITELAGTDIGEKEDGKHPIKKIIFRSHNSGKNAPIG